MPLYATGGPHRRAQLSFGHTHAQTTHTTLNTRTTHTNNTHNIYNTHNTPHSTHHTTLSTHNTTLALHTLHCAEGSRGIIKSFITIHRFTYPVL